MVTKVGLILFRLLVSEALVFQITYGCGFNKQMSRCEKRRENFAVRRASRQIQNNAALIGIGVYESQATFRIFNIAGERAGAAGSGHHLAVRL